MSVFIVLHEYYTNAAIKLQLLKVGMDNFVCIVLTFYKQFKNAELLHQNKCRYYEQLKIYTRRYIESLLCVSLFTYLYQHQMMELLD